MSPDRPTGPDRHKKRAVEVIAHEAATFISREAGTQSLITVTHALLNSAGARAEVYVSVFPSEMSVMAINFLNRNAGEFRDYLRTHARLNPLPKIVFMQDDGQTSVAPLDNTPPAP